MHSFIDNKMLWEIPQKLLQCISCDINNCESLHRVVKIYNKQVHLISHIFKDSYSMKDILTDYNHVKEAKYNLNAKKQFCSRHQRYNDLNYKTQYFVANVQDIVMQKLFDQIHLYLYHPLTENSKKEHLANKRFGIKIYKQNIENNEEKNQIHLKYEEKKHENTVQV